MARVDTGPVARSRRSKPSAILASSSGLDLRGVVDLRVELRPSWISQHTSEAILGLRARVYLDLLSAFKAWGGEIIKVGKSRLTNPDELTRYLRSLPSSGAPVDAEETEPSASAADDVNEAFPAELARDLGIERRKLK